MIPGGMSPLVIQPVRPFSNPSLRKVPSGNVPLPESAAVVGLFTALLVTDRVDVRVPSAVGENVTAIVHPAPAASVAGQVVVREKSPVVAMLLIDIPRVPVFVSVTVRGALWVPTCWSPKDSDDGERDATAAAGCVPIPVRATVCGASGASCANESVPLRVPVEFGRKVTDALQLAPAESVAGQLFVWAKSPVAETFAIASAAPPTFVRVTVRG